MLKGLRNKIHNFRRGKNGGRTDSINNYQQFIQKFKGDSKCYLTGKPIDMNNTSSYHLDHVTPSSKGGTNNVDNCEIASSDANRAKSDMSLEAFVELCKDVCKNFGVF